MVDYIRYYLFLVTFRDHRDRIFYFSAFSCSFFFADVFRPFYEAFFIQNLR